jgi:triacylglycerol esterase/lipase EstA (alpha/beta hydrolase family)
MRKYDSIIIIAHSLGGLITKHVILDLLKRDAPLKIKQFISLAVPHDGANLALFAKSLSSNIQIENLVPTNELVKKLNNDWIQTSPEKLPKVLYFQGKHDTVIPNTSSVGYETTTQIVLHFEEDHSSIAKPSSNKSSVYLAVEQTLKGF